MVNRLSGTNEEGISMRAALRLHLHKHFHKTTPPTIPQISKRSVEPKIRPQPHRLNSERPCAAGREVILRQHVDQHALGMLASGERAGRIEYGEIAAEPYGIAGAGQRGAGFTVELEAASGTHGALAYHGGARGPYPARHEFARRARARVGQHDPWRMGGDVAADCLVGNGVNTIQIVGQFPHPLARRVVVGALGCLLKGTADVGDGLESKHGPGATHLMAQICHGLKVTSIQGIQNHDGILPAVLEIRGGPICEILIHTQKNGIYPAAFLF